MSTRCFRARMALIALIIVGGVAGIATERLSAQEQSGNSPGAPEFGNDFVMPPPPTEEEIKAEAKEVWDETQRYYAEMKEAHAKLSAEQEAIRKEMFEAMVTPEAFEELPSRLVGEMVDIEVEVAAVQARRDAIRVAIERLTENAERRIAADAVTEKLEKIAELRTRRVKALMTAHGHGLVSEALDIAQIEASKAEIDLARHIEGMLESTGIDTVGGLNQQLLDTEIKITELKARQQAIRERLEAIQGVADIHSQYMLNAVKIEGLVKQLATSAGLTYEQCEDIARSQLGNGFSGGGGGMGGMW